MQNGELLQILFTHCNIVYCQFARKFGMIKWNEWYFFAPNKTFGAVSTTDGRTFAQNMQKYNLKTGAGRIIQALKDGRGRKKAAFRRSVTY